MGCVCVAVIGAGGAYRLALFHYKGDVPVLPQPILHSVAFPSNPLRQRAAPLVAHTETGEESRTDPPPTSCLAGHIRTPVCPVLHRSSRTQSGAPRRRTWAVRRVEPGCPRGRVVMGAAYEQGSGRADKPTTDRPKPVATLILLAFSCLKGPSSL